MLSRRALRWAWVLGLACAAMPGLGLAAPAPGDDDAAPAKTRSEERALHSDVAGEAEHHEHHADEHADDVHEGRTRTVVVEVPTDGPIRPKVGSSDLHIEVGELREVPRRSAEELLTLGPGITLINEGGQNHPSTLFVRGFEAEDGRDLEFTVEGVPINEVGNSHGHGFADTHFIIPELVTSLRITQGPFDARQGDFAVAGSAGYSLGLPERGLHVRTEYGSFNTARVASLWGPERHESGTFIGVDATRGDGFGANRTHVSGRVMGGYAHTFGQHTHLRVLGTAYNSWFQQAGVVRLDDFESRSLPCAGDFDSQFFCTYDPNQGARLSRYGLSARLFRHDHAATYSVGLFAVGRTQLFRENFTGFVEGPDTPEGLLGDGLEQRYRVLTTGMRASYGLRWQWGHRTQGLDLGYDLRWDAAESEIHRTRRDDGNRYATLFDNDLHVVNPAPYVAASFAPLNWLDLNLGTRLDFWFFDLQPQVTEGAEPAVDVDAYAFAAQPRASATVSPLPWLQWLTAYGIGSRSLDPNGLTQDGKNPIARAQSAETGFAFHWHELQRILDLETRAVGFYTHVDRDVAFDETDGRNTEIGESHRYGVSGSGRFGVAEWLDLSGSVTWTEAYVPPPGAGPFEWNAGERVPLIPRLTVRGDATLWHGFHVRGEHFTWHTGIGVSHVGPRPLPEGARGNRITVVDLGGSLRWRWIELGVKIQNLLDARYRLVELNYDSNFAGSGAMPPNPMLHFIPGAPLTAMGVLTLHFEPGEAAHFRRDRASPN